MTEEVIMNGERPPENGLPDAAPEASSDAIKAQQSVNPVPELINGHSQQEETPLNGLSDDHDFGIDNDTLFQLSSKFFKDNEGKAFHASYDNRNKLVALTMQAKHGPFAPDKIKPAASLDFVGRDRRQAWQDLGQMSRDEAITKFASLLNEICPLFRPFLEAHKREREERLRQQEETARAEKERAEREAAEQARAAEETARREQEAKEQEKRQIQELLNRQTYTQFAAYAAQQYPNNQEQQQTLIRQLQEHHYQQYMAQMVQYQQRQLQQTTTSNNPLSVPPPYGPPLANATNGPTSGAAALSQDLDNLSIQNRPAGSDLDQPAEQSYNRAAAEAGDGVDGEGSDDEPTEEGQFAPAQMWTRKEIQIFKDAIIKEGGDGIIKVGHGEIVTVRVPTHPEGSCIFWEFATDSYDIGFGLLFEWTSNPGHQVSVHVSESEDSDEDEEDEVAAADGAVGMGANGDDADPEKAMDAIKASFKDDGPPTSVIIPIYRRDSHEEVYAGSHPYPGRGVYLLKFDNSYSLWRSKSLYYRVYYTR